MIEIEHLTKKIGRGTEVLSDISFKVQEGEMIALLGSSGSGKTTLFRCLALKEPWTKGRYIYKNQDVLALNAWKRQQVRKEIAYLEEKPFLHPQKSALNNVLSGRWRHFAFWRKITGLVASDEHMLAADYLENVGLLDKMNVKADKLSGGEIQRVAIAKALVQGAKVIFADEPVSGLDPESAGTVMHDFQLLCRKKKATIFCSLHQVELAEKYATRIIGLAGGRIVLDTPARKLTSRERDLIFNV